MVEEGVRGFRPGLECGRRGGPQARGTGGPDDDGRWLFPSPHLRNGWGQPSPSGPAPLPTLITSGHIPGCVSS